MSDRWKVTAPGRVNLLGEHVDYNDGPVLPAAIDRHMTMTAVRLPGRAVHLRAVDLDQETAFDLDALESKRTLDGAPLPGWALYPAGVAWALQQHDFPVSAVQAEFSSNVPMGSGLSSSAAVEVGFAALWRALSGRAASAMDLARWSQEAENRYVGVNCGLMDQFASAHGVEGHALYLDTRSLDWRAVPLPPGAAIVIADSRMRRSLANSAYNERRAACEQAVALLKPHLPGIRALRDVTPAQFEPLASQLPETVRLRARHVVEECARVFEAVPLLEAGDAAGFGRLMLAGHASLRDLYQVSIPELDALVEIAAGLPGCWGARLSGAGFGGCTVSLVAVEQAEDFIARLKEEYLRRCGKQAEVYLCRASRGATVEEL